MKQNIIITIFLVLLQLTNFSQIGANYSFTMGSMRSKEWNSFATSYASYLSNTITNSDLKMGFAYGSCFGLDVNVKDVDILENFYIGFRSGNLNSSAFAEFGAERRDFKLKEKYWYVPVGMQFGEYDGSILFALGFGVSESNITSSYTYFDGTKSTGTERYLNGIFTSNTLIAIPQMVYTVHLPFDDKLLVSCFFDIGYRFSMSATVGFEDKLYIQGTAIDLQDVDYKFIPRDFESFSTNPDYDLLDAKNTVNKFTGIHFNIGIKIGIRQ
jgi:hypothetical protein